MISTSVFAAFLHFYSSLLFFTYPTIFIIFQRTRSQGHLNVVGLQNTSDSEQSRPLLPHRSSPHLRTTTVNTETTRFITIPRTKLDRVSRNELHNVDVSACLSLFIVAAGTVYVQLFLDVVFDFSINSKVFYFLMS